MAVVVTTLETAGIVTLAVLAVLYAALTGLYAIGILVGIVVLFSGDILAGLSISAMCALLFGIFIYMGKDAWEGYR